MRFFLVNALRLIADQTKVHYPAGRRYDQDSEVDFRIYLFWFPLQGRISPNLLNHHASGGEKSNRALARFPLRANGRARD